MNKIKNFFVKFGKGFWSLLCSIGIWFKSWVVSVDGRRPKFVSIGLWFKNWFVEVDGKPNHFVKIGRWVKSLFVPVDNELPKLKSMLNSKNFESFFGSLIAILGGLLVGLIIMLIVSPGEALPGFFVILKGGFNAGGKSLGDMLGQAVPIIFTGLSVAFAFKTGLFNIGASGQFMVGMYATYVCAFHFQFFGAMTWLFALLFGFFAGAIWGAIPGIFKSLLNVNEVITSIMFNYIGMYLIDALIKSDANIYRSVEVRVNDIPAVAKLPTLGMDTFLSNKVNIGLFLAVIASVVLYIILNKTTFGYELKATGQNKNAAKYAGMNEKRNVILSMVIAGALAGIGGGIFALSGRAGAQYSPSNILASQGFEGIAVALLGNASPIGAFISGVFIAHIKRGGFYIQGSYSFKPEIIDVAIGITIYFSAFSLFIKSLLSAKRKKENKLPSTETADDITAISENTIETKEGEE